MKKTITFLLTALTITSTFAQPEGKFNIINYGAFGDGKALNTDAINKAISVCNESGGGTVIIPAGTYISGTIFLKSNVNLRINQGAVLKGSGNIDDYMVNDRKHALIVAQDIEDVAITGNGMIDANGYAFVNMDEVKIVEPRFQDYDSKYTRQGKDYMSPKFGTEDGPVKPKDRRPFPSIEINNCKHILMKDVTLKNTPSWAIRVKHSEYADFIGFDILNNPLIPNSDGIHVTASRIIHISDIHFEGGDDAIIVSGLGGDPNKNAENITVSDCTIMTKSAGIRIGWSDCDIRNCVFQNLVIYSSNRGIGVFQRDSGTIENILFSNITINTRMYKGHWWGNAEPIHVSTAPRFKDTKLGKIKNIHFSNIIAKSENGIVVHGWENSIIEGLVFDNIKLRITNSPINDTYGGNFDLRPTYVLEKALFKHDIPGFYCRFTDGTRISNFNLEWENKMHPLFSYGIECEDFENLVIDGFNGRQAHLNSSLPVISLKNGSAAIIRNSFAAKNSGTFLKLSNVDGQKQFVNNALLNAKKAIEPENYR